MRDSSYFVSQLSSYFHLRSSKNKIFAHLSILSDVIGRKVYFGDCRRRQTQVSEPREAKVVSELSFLSWLHSVEFSPLFQPSTWEAEDVRYQYNIDSGIWGWFCKRYVPYIALVCCFKDTVPCEFFSSPSVLDHIFDANTRFYTHFWSLVIAFPPPLEEMEWTVKPSLTEKIWEYANQTGLNYKLCNELFFFKYQASNFPCRKPEKASWITRDQATQRNAIEFACYLATHSLSCTHTLPPPPIIWPLGYNLAAKQTDSKIIKC